MVLFPRSGFDTAIFLDHILGSLNDDQLLDIVENGEEILSEEDSDDDGDDAGDDADDGGDTNAQNGQNNNSKVAPRKGS